MAAQAEWTQPILLAPPDDGCESVQVVFIGRPLVSVIDPLAALPERIEIIPGDDAEAEC